MEARGSQWAGPSQRAGRPLHRPLRAPEAQPHSPWPSAPPLDGEGTAGSRTLLTCVSPGSPTPLNPPHHDVRPCVWDPSTAQVPLRNDREQETRLKQGTCPLLKAQELSWRHGIARRVDAKPIPDRQRGRAQRAQDGRAGMAEPLWGQRVMAPPSASPGQVTAPIPAADARIQEQHPPRPSRRCGMASPCSPGEHSLFFSF